MFEIKQKDGTYYWILKAPNGQGIAISYPHTSKAAVENSIAAVKKYAENAEIKDID